MAGILRDQSRSIAGLLGRSFTSKPVLVIDPGMHTIDIRAASLGAGAVRYSFTVTDFHRPPLAGLPAHPSTPSFIDGSANGSTRP